MSVSILRRDPFQCLIPLMLRRSKRKCLEPDPTRDPMTLESKPHKKLHEGKRVPSETAPPSWSFKTFYIRAAESQREKERGLCASPFLASVSRARKKTSPKSKGSRLDVLDKTNVRNSTVLSDFFSFFHIWSFQHIQ